MSEVSGLVAVIRRLSLAQSLHEIMQIVAPGARSLLGADGVTFVLRDGPPVEGPLEGGFGNRLVERLLRGFGGEMRLEPLPDGLTYTISVAVTE